MKKGCWACLGVNGPCPRSAATLLVLISIFCLLPQTDAGIESTHTQNLDGGSIQSRDVNGASSDCAVQLKQTQQSFVGMPQVWSATLTASSTLKVFDVGLTFPGAFNWTAAERDLWMVWNLNNATAPVMSLPSWLTTVWTEGQEADGIPAGTSLAFGYYWWSDTTADITITHAFPQRICVEIAHQIAELDVLEDSLSLSHLDADANALADHIANEHAIEISHHLPDQLAQLVEHAIALSHQLSHIVAHELAISLAHKVAHQHAKCDGHQDFVPERIVQLNDDQHAHHVAHQLLQCDAYQNDQSEHHGDANHVAQPFAQLDAVAIEQCNLISIVDAHCHAFTLSDVLSQRSSTSDGTMNMNIQFAEMSVGGALYSSSSLSGLSRSIISQDGDLPPAYEFTAMAGDYTTLRQSFVFHQDSMSDSFAGLAYDLSPGSIKWSVRLTSTAAAGSGVPVTLCYSLESLFQGFGGVAGTQGFDTGRPVERWANTPHRHITTYVLTLNRPSGRVVARLEVFDLALVDGDTPDDLAPVTHSVSLRPASGDTPARFVLELVMPTFQSTLSYDPSISMGTLVDRSAQTEGSKGGPDPLLIGAAVGIPVAVVLVVLVIVIGLLYRRHQNRLHVELARAVNFDNNVYVNSQVL